MLAVVHPASSATPKANAAVGRGNEAELRLLRAAAVAGAVSKESILRMGILNVIFGLKIN